MKYYVFEDVEKGLQTINQLCSKGWVVLDEEPEIIYKNTEKTWMDDNGMWNTLKDNIPWKVRATLELIKED